MTYLIKNYLGIYCFRRFVPKDLVVILGIREIRRSLNTRDKDRALEGLYQLTQATNHLFTSTRMKKRQETILPPSEIKLTGFKLGNLSIESLELDPLHADTEITLFKNIVNSAQPTPTVTPPTVAPILFHDLAKLFLADRTANKWNRSKSMNSLFLGSVLLFIKILGNRHVNDYTISDAETFRDTCKTLPAGFMRSEKLSKTSLKNLATIKAPKMQHATISEHIKRLREIFEFGNEREFLTKKNIFNDILIIVDRNKGKPFNNNDLIALFDWKNYSTLLDDSKQSHYWACLIALFSGMRLGEIFFLTKNDIKFQDGIWFFDINDNDSKNVKTKSSVRIVPIHSKLIELGFLEFIKQLAPGVLFPEYKVHSVRGQAGVKFSNAFTNYRRTIGIDGSREKVFHSFRHTVVTSLQLTMNISSNPNILSRLLGHSLDNTSLKLYGINFALDVLKSEIEKLDFNFALKNFKPWTKPRTNTGDKTEDSKKK